MHRRKIRSSLPEMVSPCLIWTSKCIGFVGVTVWHWTLMWIYPKNTTQWKQRFYRGNTNQLGLRSKYCFLHRVHCFHEIFMCFKTYLLTWTASHGVVWPSIKLELWTIGDQSLNPNRGKNRRWFFPSAYVLVGRVTRYLYWCK